MVMTKTEKARHALRDRGSLSVQARQILILCDGIRSRQEIVGWLGDSAGGLIDSLLAQGLLHVHPARASAPVSAPMHGGALMPAVAETTWAQASLSPLAVETLPARTGDCADAVSASVAKRSLAACKMYAVGILQMQRSAEAQALVGRLQRSSNERDLLHGVQDLLQFLQQKTNASYAQSVEKHLAQILPQVHWQTLQQRLALADWT